MRSPASFPAIWWTLFFILVAVSACGQGPLEANGIPSHSVSIKTGRTLELTLQTIGPGEYASPPSVSSSSIRWLDVTLVTPAVPAGPTQRFRFEAVAPGRAVIVFHHTAQGTTIEDTVDVH
jgi:hypothetical protein